MLLALLLTITVPQAVLQTVESLVLRITIAALDYAQNNRVMG